MARPLGREIAAAPASSVFSGTSTGQRRSGDGPDPFSSAELGAAADVSTARLLVRSHGEFQRLPCRSPGWPTTCSSGGRSANAPPTGSPEMWVWRRRGATINDVWLCLEDFQASRSSAQNAITGAGRAARSAQCQSPRRMRSAAPAICHGNSAWGTSGPPSRGVRQLPPRAPSPIRTGQGSAGRRFEDPRASANNMTVRLSAVPL